MTRHSWLFVLLLASRLFFPCSAWAAEIVSYAQIRSGTLKIIFRFEDGKEDWVAPIVADAPGYITLAERFLGRPFPYRDYIEIKGCHSCTSHREGRTIYLGYDYEPTTNPALLFHEINHFWFFYWSQRTSEEWLIEGVSSFLPILMREYGALPDLDRYHLQIDRWWGLDWYPPEDFKDTPLYPFSEKKRAVVYNKSYRLQYLLHCLLGESKYRRFVKKVFSTKRRTNTYVIQILNSLQRRNWRRSLSGWLIGSTYKDVSLRDFWRDPDADGLSSAREVCSHSDKARYDTDGDLLPDGAEVALSTNPRVADSDGLDLLRAYGPFIDGNGAEWDLITSTSEMDPIGDTNGPLWSDLLELRYLIKEETLFILAKTAAKPETDSSVFFDVLVDTDFDWNNNEEFAFFLRNPSNPWQYHSALGISSISTKTKAARGDVIEMAIPLDEIPTDAFRIVPILRNDSTKSNYDQFNDWIVIHK